MFQTLPESRMPQDTNILMKQPFFVAGHLSTVTRSFIMGAAATSQVTKTQSVLQLREQPI